MSFSLGKQHLRVYGVKALGCIEAETQAREEGSKAGTGPTSLSLICKFSLLPSDTPHQQRGIPGLQCEPGAGTSREKQNWEGGNRLRGFRPKFATTTTPPFIPGHDRARAQGREAPPPPSPGHLP